MGTMKKSYRRKRISGIEFFAGRRDGGHRSSAEEFLAMEAKGKIFHLDGGKTLLDFGCGAGELLAYYAPEYEKS